MKDVEKDIGIRKVSLASLDNFGLATIKVKEQSTKDVAPKDKLLFVHILFLLLGLMHFIPYSFFVTANAYWMYKFRNVNADITDTDARTVLQTHFSPANGILSAICSPVMMLVSTVYGFKIKARVRVLAMLSIMSLSFIAGTAFVKINTDSWQLLFFILTICILAIISIADAAIAAANLAILSRFPPYFLKVYLIGEGLGGISSATLQILSLAMGTSTEVSALFYFISGSGLMTLTLVLFYLSKYNKLFNYHVNSMKEDVTKEILKFSEAKALAKKVWAPTVAMLLMLLTIVPVLPNVSSLVVSENYGSGNDWSDKYFVPVITFFYSDVAGLMGRITASKISKTFDGIPLCIFMLVRMVILVPLVYFCNAHPRNYLPVLFHHDWQYVIILTVFSFSNGYIMNMVYLDVPHLVGREKTEDTYLVMLTIVAVVYVSFLPISMFSVDLL